MYLCNRLFYRHIARPPMGDVDLRSVRGPAPPAPAATVPPLLDQDMRSLPPAVPHPVPPPMHHQQDT